MCTPAHLRGAAVVTAGDLFVRFNNFRLSNCYQKSDRDGKRIKNYAGEQTLSLQTAKTGTSFAIPPVLSFTG